jgi:hypothetical protein
MIYLLVKMPHGSVFGNLLFKAEKDALLYTAPNGSFQYKQGAVISALLALTHCHLAYDWLVSS